MCAVCDTWLALFSRAGDSSVAAWRSDAGNLGGPSGSRIDVSVCRRNRRSRPFFQSHGGGLEPAAQIEASSRDATAANAELDQRRRQWRPFSKAIPTGSCRLMPAAASRMPTRHCNACFYPEGLHGRTALARGAQRGRIPPECCRISTAAAPAPIAWDDHQPNGNVTCSARL